MPNPPIAPAAQAQQAPSRALVLSGGGARGAYEVGVLSYVLRHLPQGLYERNRFRLFCGTSVGAINACYMAATAQRPNHDITRLEHLWKALRVEAITRLSTLDLLKLPSDLWSLFGGGQGHGVLLNDSMLTRTVMGEIAWPQIARNIASGIIQGVTVSTTHIQSGRTVVFIDTQGQTIPSWTRDKRRIARATRIGPLHALASAAIPMLFPAVSIDGTYYCDGGLRQNTPLSPALRLGADRVLVVAVGHGDAAPGDASQAANDVALELEAPPNATLVLGKVLNALMLDHLDYDLAQLRGFNRLLEDGEATFGQAFAATLSQASAKVRGAGYRKVVPLVIRPSRDLGELAWAWMQREAHQIGGLLGRLLRHVGQSESGSSADFLSYLSFDGRFVARLIELGMHDADAAREQLISFFQD